MAEFLYARKAWQSRSCANVWKLVAALLGSFDFIPGGTSCVLKNGGLGFRA